MTLSFFLSSEGPRMFCRSGKLGDQREAWEEKRTSLRDVLDFKEIYMKKWIIIKKKLLISLQPKLNVSLPH